GQRECERRLSPELLDHAIRFFGVADVEHVLEGERLEVEAIAGVVIGRYGLGIAVHHDRLDTELLQGEGGMAAAVIEFATLPDPVRPAAENHDLLATARLGFAFALVARIEIRREALE